MKIAYSWLKEYIQTDLAPEEIARILTETGLEVAGIEKVEVIKGSLSGVVVGEVKYCEPHPNSDHLNLTKVDVGSDSLLPIVCGASNVAVGQKVMVATVGTVFYDGEKEFLIKKAKLRGEPSEGMICSEEELGVGTDNSGIMVLPNAAKLGTSAKEYFGLDEDYAIEIDLTPNRIDGASHIGVARDLAAYLQTHGSATSCYERPTITDFQEAKGKKPVSIIIENTASCPRYAAICLENIKVGASPEWLQKRLKTIGLTPVNNVVDVTNYVLFETGQPLHAFDRQIVGEKLIVKTLTEGTKFTTLDEVERSLHSEDLMICNSEGPMCIAGVFGGIASGVTENTTSVFLESAYFNPIQVRKTARRHGLNTDASFRFERGVDPEMVLFALKRAALLLQEVTGAIVSSEIMEVYSQPIKGALLKLSVEQVNHLTGISITNEKIKQILEALEINVLSEDEDTLTLQIPAYRVDVTREADVIEEILRIYGYSNIPVKKEVKSVLSYAQKPDTYRLKNNIGDYLSANGFYEIMNNSLTKTAYYENSKLFPEEEGVFLQNPLSQDLATMRRTLLFGGLESIAYNANRKRSNLCFYEFGKTYHYNKKENTTHPVQHYTEHEKLGVFLTGNLNEQSWNSKREQTNFFHLKAYTLNLLEKLGVKEEFTECYISDEVLTEGLELFVGKQLVARLGQVSKKMLQKMTVNQAVYFAEINWNEALKLLQNKKIRFQALAKYPEVRRDFALLLDDTTSFADVKKVIKQSERKLLKSISLFDVYKGEKLPQGKKSYAVAVILQDEEATLTEKQIEKVSQKLQKAFEKQLGANLR